MPRLCSGFGLIEESLLDRTAARQIYQEGAKQFKDNPQNKDSSNPRRTRIPPKNRAVRRPN